MSESQYSVGEEASDEDYDNSSQRKPRLRLVKTPKEFPNRKITDRFFLNGHLSLKAKGSNRRNYQAIYREPKPAQEKRLTRGKINPLPKDISYNEEDEGQNRRNLIDVDKFEGEKEIENQMEEEDQFSLFNLQIGNIIWKRKRQGTDQDEYLIKYRGRSYLHVEWLTEQQLAQTVKSPKNKINRFNKTFYKRLAQGKYDEEAIDEEKYFDPAYLEVDRILTATQLFPIIHQKKANEIKGKWSESLMIVCSKLLNFTRSKIHYGTPFCQPVSPQRDGCPDYAEVIKNPMDLGTILNKIYLDIYKNAKEFWNDVGLVWRNCLKYNKTQNSDLRTLGLTLRECSIFLYDQWFHLCEQRYQRLTQQFPQLTSEALLPQNQQNHKMDIEEPVKNQVNPQKEDGNQQKVEKMEQENNGHKKDQQQVQKPKKVGQEKQFQSDNQQPNNIQNQNGQVNSQQNIDDSSQKPSSNKKQQQDDQEREYLNMDQFYENNIFLTQKKVQNPTNRAQLEILNPGQFSYAWLDQEGDGQQFLSHSYEYIDRLDMKRLDINVQVDRLYMVKWKNLSYTQATWQLQSVISCPDKIAQFKNINKALGKDARTSLDSQREKHIAIRDYQHNRKKKFNAQQINDMRTKLYSFDVGTKKQPHQYNVQNGPIYKHQKRLRSYQVESLNWIIRNWYQKRNMILADEMGLGKTIQSIAFLYHLYSIQNVKGPFLIIAPLSTLQHWKRTVQQWTNMNCVLYYDHNSLNGRRSIQYYQWHHINITMKGLCQQSQLNKFQILITSYQVFMLDLQTIILDVPFQFIVVDQAHRLKNRNAKILNTLKQLPCKRVLLLTGTPIQNNTAELWALLNYIHPDKFSSHEMFKRQFGDLSNNQQVQRLNKVLKPYMLRRMKQDVEQSIPPLMQTIIDVQMTNIQKTIYRALYEKNKNMLVKGLSSTGGTSTYNTNLNNLQIQLRKCCNHPCLIKELQHDLLRECQTYQDRIEKIINASGKMVLVSKLLQKYKKQGKKVLIFSQFTHMLQLIEQFLKYRQYKYERIDGQIKAKQRQSAIDRYNNPAKNRDVFLLSTKAGGVGINLTSANIVIIYDSDWNPQNDVQATARAHRIGQKSEVKVYRLVTSNTYQTQMFERATQKLGLDKAIFISGNFKDTKDTNETQPPETKISKQQMQTLLKKGILGFLQANENQHFFQGNVDDIIAKNSRIAKYSMINGGACTVQKRTFTSNEADKQLKLNDPNFWNIVLKNVQSPTQLLLKKVKQFTDFRDLQAQKKLMNQAAHLTQILIQNKLSLSGFNADDQINLSEFLTYVNSQRQFQKVHREKASLWLEQICKPSRRFKKLTEDLEIDKKIMNKKNINTRSEQKDGGDIFDQERDEQEVQESDDKQKLPSEQKKQQMLKKLCFLCQNPKCTYHCKGFCKRAFHGQCRKRFEQQGVTSFQEITGKLDITQLCLDQQTLKQAMVVDFTCDDCKSNQVSCFICKKKGYYYGVQYQKTKKIKGKPGEQKQVTPKNKKKNQVTKCSTANCSKYFHSKCVETYAGKDHFKYIDSNSLHFRCSLHYCDKCGVSGDTMSILQCVRCPKALHIRCMDKQKVIKLSKKQFICDAHFKNKKDLKKASQRFNLASLKKVSTKKQKSQKQKEVEQSQQQHESPKNQKLQEVIAHNYKTRRNRGNYNQEVLHKVRVVEQRKPVRLPAKDKNTMLTYEELGITPIHQFDYENYTKDWCRYCGTRYSSNFTKGPWGSKTLCTVHYINWNNSKTLNLDDYKQKPKRPINPDSEQQLKYITTCANKHPQMTKQQLIESLEKKNNKKQL